MATETAATAGKPLTGRTLLVTGASRGTGRATVELTHTQGACVVLHHATSTEVADELAAALGERVHVVQGDLTDPAARRAVWERAVDWAGRIDVLVNNAGAWLASPVDDVGAWEEGWVRNLELNLTAPADLCRFAIGHFRDHGGGVIINVSSRSGHRGDDAEHLAYGAAKGGLLALTRGIARGFGRDGVLAYAVAPGWVRTSMAEEHIAATGDDGSDLPLGEITPPGDVAEVIAFLAGGRARHTTGATIDITGADYVR